MNNRFRINRPRVSKPMKIKKTDGDKKGALSLPIPFKRHQYDGNQIKSLLDAYSAIKNEVETQFPNFFCDQKSDEDKTKVVSQGLQDEPVSQDLKDELICNVARNCLRYLDKDTPWSSLDEEERTEVVRAEWIVEHKDFNSSEVTPTPSAQENKAEKTRVPS